MTARRNTGTAEPVHAIGKLEARVDRLEEGQQTLIAGMSRIETIAEQLAANQKGVFGRLNRPWQWGVVISVFVGIFTLAGVFATVLTLIIEPIKEDIAHIQIDDKDMSERDLKLHMMFNEKVHENELSAAVNAEALRWLEKVEERYYLATTSMSPREGYTKPCCQGEAE